MAVNFNLVTQVATPAISGDYRFTWGNLVISPYGFTDSVLGLPSVQNVSFGVYPPAINTDYVPVPKITHGVNFSPVDFNLVDQVVLPNTTGDIRFKWGNQTPITVESISDSVLGLPYIYNGQLALHPPGINSEYTCTPVVFNYVASTQNPTFKGVPVDFNFYQSSSPDANALNFDFTGLLGIAFGSIYNGEIGSVNVYNSDQYIAVGGDNQSEINEPEIILLLNKTFPPSIDSSEFGTLTIYKVSKEIFAPSISQSSISSGNVIYFSNTDLLTQNFIMMLF